ncbi:hypothetical protein AALO_G00288880 [Alosa alosa]|uniref:ATP synthase peripheral stalk subunit F6, mitochondrial n=1 Tax=Alosa alosa TaxID=278164 RepID=A0AAV6FH68_9TELE|nr:hypothetical protein AALO_G00288880 [Alosa alosa]
MATSFLRMGRICCGLKPFQVNLCTSWRTIPAVAYSSKLGDPKRAPRKTHIKKAKPKPKLDVAQLLISLGMRPLAQPSSAAPDAPRHTKPAARAAGTEPNASLTLGIATLQTEPKASAALEFTTEAFSARVVAPSNPIEQTDAESAASGSAPVDSFSQAVSSQRAAKSVTASQRNETSASPGLTETVTALEVVVSGVSPGVTADPEVISHESTAHPVDPVSAVPTLEINAAEAPLALESSDQHGTDAPSARPATSDSSGLELSTGRGGTAVVSSEPAVTASEAGSLEADAITALGRGPDPEIIQDATVELPITVAAAQEAPTEELAQESAEARLDPVQRLFLQKIREYQTLSQSAEGVPEAGSDDNEFQRRLAEEEAKLQRLYGGCDLTKFPDFNFPEPRLDEDSTK